METPPTCAENAAQGASFRAALRRERIAAREALAAVDHAERSRRVEAALEALLAGHDPGLLGFCWPLRAEYDARPLVMRLMARGWRACLPVVVAEDAPLAFRVWTPETPTLPDRYGIPTPVEGPDVRPDVLLLPLVAFDDAGYRLGYGGGYFDRTLAALVPRPWAIGVGFEVARVASIAPGAHDVRLDAIVTEAGASRHDMPR